MSISVLICDDSAMARKQMARTLPKEWDVEITYATNGAEGLDAIRAGIVSLSRYSSINACPLNDILLLIK